MKVVFFSESQIEGKVDRYHPNCRNDLAWSIMMDADWCHTENNQQENMI